MPVPLPPRMSRLGPGIVVPVACVVLAVVLSLLASHQEGISGHLFFEIALWGFILGGAGLAIVVAGSRYLDEPPAPGEREPLTSDDPPLLEPAPGPRAHD